MDGTISCSISFSCIYLILNYFILYTQGRVLVLYYLLAPAIFLSFNYSLLPRFFFVGRTLIIKDGITYISGIYTCREDDVTRKRYRVTINGNLLRR